MTIYRNDRQSVRHTLRRKPTEEGKVRPPLHYLARKIDERSGNIYENKGTAWKERAGAT